jgi:hypothetical protein
MKPSGSPDWKALITFAEHLAVNTVEVGEANIRTGARERREHSERSPGPPIREASRGYWSKTNASHFCHQVHFVHFCGWLGP